MEVKIPKEIKAYKEKLIMNLTLRQTLSLIAALVTIVPSYIFGVYTLKISSDLVSWFVILLGLPIFGIGFFTYNNMSVEKFAWQIIKTGFIFPIKRKYAIKSKFGEAVSFDEVAQKKQKGKNKGSKRKTGGPHVDAEGTSYEQLFSGWDFYQE